MNIIFTRNALINIKNYYERIKNYAGLQSARKFRKKIFDRVKMLETFPRAGEKSEKYSSQNIEIRFLTQEKYRIYYQLKEQTIFIIRVILSSQEFEGIDTI